MSYPVLAPVSEGYPKAEGRLLTCYSPVRRSSTPEEAFPHDLHVLSTPPAFVLSQDQTLQHKPKESHHMANKPKPNNKLGTGITNTLLSSQETSTHLARLHRLARATPGATPLRYPVGPPASNLSFRL